MYNEQQDQFTNPNSKAKYYRDLDGDIYRTIVTGFSTEGVQMMALRRLSDKTTWFVPFPEFMGTILIEGKRIRRYTLIENYVEKGSLNNVKRPNQSQYPGYTNDARLEPMQRPDPRYREQEGEYPRQRSFPRYTD